MANTRRHIQYATLAGVAFLVALRATPMAPMASPGDRPPAKWQVPDHVLTSTRRRHGDRAMGTREPVDAFALTDKASGLRCLGRPFVINLEHRVDRMSNFTQGMTNAGVTNLTVINGVPHSCPQLGLTLAHITALQLCSRSHWVDSCVIMEDDFSMRLPLANTTALIDNFYADVKGWDVLMLGCNLLSHSTKSADNKTLPAYVARVIRGYTSSGYVVRRAYAEKISNIFLSDGVKHLIDGCDTNRALDVTWVTLQTRDAWYVLHEGFRSSVLGYQRPSHSDIEGKFQDYGVR